MAEKHPLYNDSTYLFDLLLKTGLLTPGQVSELEKRAVVARRKGIDLVQWLAGENIIKTGTEEPLDEADIIKAVSIDRGWNFQRLDPLELNMEIVTRTLPASFARTRLVLPLKWRGKELEVVCYYPEDRELEEDIKRACQVKIHMSAATSSDIKSIINEFFGFKKSIAAASDSIFNPVATDISNLEQYVKLASKDYAESEKHINSAVDHLLQYALEQKASDIHIEPKRNETLVRFRIDGILHDIYKLPRVVHEAICSRIKGLSRLDISEKRRPQDGRMKISDKEEESEVRVSTVPVAFGEKVVLRLQSADILFSDLDELGFSNRDFEAYSKIINNTYGIILMTGPTGSGKSTTLYSTLRHLNSPEINIVTVEDPIEMVHEDFNQIAVQPHIGVTFATILRNILRQDPDVVMIGEIRDQETAKYAVQAALTGHLVFSTLHTNDAAGAITRLEDLGLPPYLIASTLLGVVAQRLIRMNCPRCKEPMEIEAEKLTSFNCRSKGKSITAYHGAGCNYCRHTGYKGRIGIYEVLTVDEEIKKMIHEGSGEQRIKNHAAKKGMTTLKQDACRKLAAGITTLKEIIRVTS